MGFFDLFKKKKERTLYDEFQDTTVKIFRSIGKSNGIKEIDNLSDETIMHIAQEVMTTFKNSAQEKNETIPGGYLLTIAMKFIIVFATTGEQFYKDHLAYEINKYIHEGLREDYKQNLLGQ